MWKIRSIPSGTLCFGFAALVNAVKSRGNMKELTLDLIIKYLGQHIRKKAIIQNYTKLTKIIDYKMRIQTCKRNKKQM